jgi:hypothetical protein
MNRPKNMFIGGFPRAGKTTLAKRLSQALKITHVSQSSLHPAFIKCFPDLQIHSDNPSYDYVADNSAPFFIEQCHWYDKHNLGFVGDGYYFRPQHLEGHTFEAGHIVVFLGYAETNVEYATKLIRSQERSFDWTKKLDDKTLTNDFNRFKDASLGLKKLCEEKRYEYIEPGNNWEEVREETFTTLLKRSKEDS